MINTQYIPISSIGFILIVFCRKGYNPEFKIIWCKIIEAEGHLNNLIHGIQWEKETNFIISRTSKRYVREAHISQGEAAAKYEADTIPPAKRGGKHMDLFGLINMSNELRSRLYFSAGNGRIYDPGLGRFLSPDPYVQMPENSQNFNRYSYALNNPLVYTDPSGEIVFTIIGAIFAPVTGGASLALGIAIDIGGIVNTASNWKDITNNSDNFWQGLGRGSLYYAAGGINGGLSTTGIVGAIGGGAIQSGMNEAIQGGDLEDIWTEAGIGGLSNLIGYGVGSGTSKLLSKSLSAVGIEGKIVNKMISEGIGGAAGVYGVNVSNAKLRGASWEQSFKESFNWTVAAGGVYGAAKGYFEATRPPKPDGPKYWDPNKHSYYSDEIAPPDFPEIQLDLGLYYKGQPKVIPPWRPSGYWKTIWKWDDMNNFRKYRIWVED